MSKKRIDRQEMQKAVEENDERKLFDYFWHIASMKPYRVDDIEDWKMIAVHRAFRYLPSYTPDRGLAFSYFYRIIIMEMVYQYRRFKKMNVVEMVDINSPVAQSIQSFDRHPEEEDDWLEVGGRIIDKDVVKKVYNEYKHKCFSSQKSNFGRDIKEKYGLKGKDKISKDTSMEELATLSPTKEGI